MKTLENSRVKWLGLIAACLGLQLVASATASASPQATKGNTAKGTQAPRFSALEGEWSGTLQVGETQLELVLHLSKDSQGQWHAKIDSVSQAVFGMEASNVARTSVPPDDTLKFELTAVGARYQGKISTDHSSIRGVWEQGGTGLPLRFEKRAAGTAARASANSVSKAEGTWQGAIETGNMRIRLQMHLSHDDKGQLVAAIDSIDQGVQGIPASRVTEKGGELKFEIAAFNASYTGTLSATKNEINGQWSQNQNSEALNFRRSEQPLEVRRPQTPSKPFPYKEEEVSFLAGDGKSILAATLTVPPGSGPFPTAVLLAGSGPNDRDESIAGHKPFLVLSDFLTRKGIVVLRYDKRGSGKSTGDFASATIEDLEKDARAVLTFLKSRKEVDDKRLGVIGHGEGAILAAILATTSSDNVHWAVLLAPQATDGERTLLRQSELVARTGGMAEEQISRSLEFDRKAYKAVKEEKDFAVLQKRLEALVQESGMSASMPPAAIQAQIRSMTSPWFREYLTFDPEPILEKISCPVLVLSGDRDLQVDTVENVPLLRKALESSGNKGFTVVEIEGVNHLFQKAQSGSPALYGAIEETIAPEVLTAIGNWVAKQTFQ
jgi:pimeloyl-ACP methyl ester carboxylesterase